MDMHMYMHANVHTYTFARAQILIHRPARTHTHMKGNRAGNQNQGGRGDRYLAFAGETGQTGHFSNRINLTRRYAPIDMLLNICFSPHALAQAAVPSVCAFLDMLQRHLLQVCSLSGSYSRFLRHQRTTLCVIVRATRRKCRE